MNEVEETPGHHVLCLCLIWKAFCQVQWVKNMCREVISQVFSAKLLNPSSQWITSRAPGAMLSHFSKEGLTSPFFRWCFTLVNADFLAKKSFKTLEDYHYFLLKKMKKHDSFANYEHWEPTEWHHFSFHFPQESFWWIIEAHACLWPNTANERGPRGHSAAPV